MPRRYTILKCLTLLLLISTNHVLQAVKVINYLFSDQKVVYTPNAGWDYWTFNGTAACPGVWTNYPGETRTISFEFTGIGITVYGYADPRQAPWRFQLDNGPREELSIEPKTECLPIKDSQGLSLGNHRVVLTPLTNSFVLTRFSVTQLEDNEVPPKSGSFRVVPSEFWSLFLCSVFSYLVSHLSYI